MQRRRADAIDTARQSSDIACGVTTNHCEETRRAMSARGTAITDIAGSARVEREMFSATRGPRERWNIASLLDAEPPPVVHRARVKCATFLCATRSRFRWAGLQAALLGLRSCIGWSTEVAANGGPLLAHLDERRIAILERRLLRRTLVAVSGIYLAGHGVEVETIDERDKLSVAEGVGAFVMVQAGQVEILNVAAPVGSGRRFRSAHDDPAIAYRTPAGARPRRANL